MDSRSLGWMLVAVGTGAIVVGALIATGALSWFGRLPGDIRIKGESTRVYIPLTSMLLVSVGLTLILNLLKRLF